MPRCQVLPLADNQAVFQIEGRERLRWHFDEKYPRPFFYPLAGPSGSSLTRMGHPGAANHDHHRGVWFAHAKVLGVDFWSDRTESRIRQEEWLCYHDSDAEAAMAVRLGWYDGHDPRPLLSQELIAAIRPLGDNGETIVELQSTFRPTAESLEFQKTNFGFLAVRVAKNISAYFGGGELTNSEGGRGEGKIFGKPARWMDYSGPVPSAGDDDSTIEGVTFIDHPTNPGQPTHWHVREDGWMGASPCMREPQVTSQRQPLQVRYLLHAHGGDARRDAADRLAVEFAATRPYILRKSKKKHTQFEIHR